MNKGNQRQGRIVKRAVGRRRRDTPEDAVDKAVGRAAEAAGSLTGDETMEIEGRALGRSG